MMLPEHHDDEPYDIEEDYDPGEECGRWDNGRLMPYRKCAQAGTEFCDWECPYGSRK